MKRINLKILLVVLAVPVLIVLLVAGVILIDIEIETIPGPVDYDNPESLPFLAERTERYIIRANPDSESPARQAALKELETIGMLDVSDDEKSRLIRERFPEESFWDEDMKDLLKAAEAGDPEAQFQLGCFYFGHPQSILEAVEDEENVFLDTGIDRTRGQCILKSMEMAGKWFRRAALQGHVKAQSRLVYSYCYGGVPGMTRNGMLSDTKVEAIIKEARTWIGKAAADGDFLANVAPFALELRFERPDTRNPEQHEAWRKQLDLLREAASQDDPRILLLLAKATSDKEEKAECYRKAAGLGSVKGMMEYASVCEGKAWERVYREKEEMEEAMDSDGNEEPEEKDEEEDEEDKKEPDNEEMAEAKLWRKKAFDAALKRLDEGSVEEFYIWLKDMYSRSRFDKVNSPLIGFIHAEAVAAREEDAAYITRILKPMFDRDLIDRKDGNLHYVNQIALIFDRHFEDLKIPGLDPGTVWSMFAKMDAPVGRRILSRLMLTGEYGIPQNKPEAFKTIRKNAGFGFDRATLGQCYLHGEGVPQDNAEGVRWLRLAARQGSKDAMCELKDYFWDNGPWHWPEALKWSILYEMYPEFDSPAELGAHMLKNVWDGFSSDLNRLWEKLTK